MTSTIAPTGTVASADGTAIAVYRSGAGPAIVLVDPALSDHTVSAKLAGLLAEHYTVLRYDRRGRGVSGRADAPTLEQETADLAAVVESATGPVILFGQSSGASLALEAAATMAAARLRGLYLWEPPYIVDNEHPPVAPDLPQRIARLVADGRRGDAVATFYREAIGIPGFGVWAMRHVMPGWRKAERMAHTLSGDFAGLAGLQQGRALPTDRWKAVSAPVVVVAGAKSEPFFHTTARALAIVLPDGTAASLPKASHGTPIMAPTPIAADIRRLFPV